MLTRLSSRSPSRSSRSRGGPAYHRGWRFSYAYLTIPVVLTIVGFYLIKSSADSGSDNLIAPGKHESAKNEVFAKKTKTENVPKLAQDEDKNDDSETNRFDDEKETDQPPPPPAVAEPVGEFRELEKLQSYFQPPSPDETTTSETMPTDEKLEKKLEITTTLGALAEPKTIAHQVEGNMTGQLSENNATNSQNDTRDQKGERVEANSLKTENATAAGNSTAKSFAEISDSISPTGQNLSIPSNNATVTLFAEAETDNLIAATNSSQIFVNSSFSLANETVSASSASLNDVTSVNYTLPIAASNDTIPPIDAGKNSTTATVSNSSRDNLTNSSTLSKILLPNFQAPIQPADVSASTNSTEFDSNSQNETQSSFADRQNGIDVRHANFSLMPDRPKTLTEYRSTFFRHGNESMMNKKLEKYDLPKQSEQDDLVSDGEKTALHEAEAKSDSIEMPASNFSSSDNLGDKNSKPIGESLEGNSPQDQTANTSTNTTTKADFEYVQEKQDPILDGAVVDQQDPRDGVADEEAGADQHENRFDQQVIEETSVDQQDRQVFRGTMDAEAKQPGDARQF